MDIPPVSNRPKTFKFPQRSFGSEKPGEKKRFQSSWFANRTWLHYDEANDLAYYHVCMVAYRDGKLNRSNLDKAFILNGFYNWKDASVGFKNTTLPGVIMIREGVEMFVFSIFVMSDAQT